MNKACKHNFDGFLFLSTFILELQHLQQSLVSVGALCSVNNYLFYTITVESKQPHTKMHHITSGIAPGGVQSFKRILKKKTW